MLHTHENDSISAREQVDLVSGVLRKRWWLIGLVGVCAGLSAWGMAKLMSPVYEATTTIRVLKEPALANMESHSYSEDGNTGGLRAEAAWFKSSRVLEAVAERLALKESVSGSPLEVALQKTTNKLKQLTGAPVNQESRLYEVVEKLRKKAIHVEELSGSNTLEVRVEWDDPEMTMQIANTAVDVFIEQFQEFNRGRAKQNREYLEQQVQLIKAQMEESEKKLVDFQKKSGIISADGRVGDMPFQADLHNLMVEKRQLELLLASANAERDKLQDGSREDSSTGLLVNEALQAALRDENSLVRTLMNQVVTCEAQIATAKGKYTEEHLATLPVQKELEAVRTSLRQELARLGVDADETSANDLLLMVQDQQREAGVQVNMSAQLQVEKESLDVRIKEYETQLSKLSAEIGEAEKQTAQLPDDLQQHLTLMRERRVDEELYTMLSQRLAAAHIDENTGLYDVRVFDPAHLPLKPIRPKVLFLVAIGTFMGLLLGVSISLALEYLDDSFKKGEEIEAYLGLPVLAELPKVSFTKKVSLLEGLPRTAKGYLSSVFRKA